MVQWLRVGAVGFGLGAALIAGPGVAAAATDDTASSSTQGSDDSPSSADDTSSSSSSEASSSSKTGAGATDNTEDTDTDDATGDDEDQDEEAADTDSLESDASTWSADDDPVEVEPTDTADADDELSEDEDVAQAPAESADYTPSEDDPDKTPLIAPPSAQPASAALTSTDLTEPVPDSPDAPLGGLSQTLWLAAAQTQNTIRNLQLPASVTGHGLIPDGLDLALPDGRISTVSAPTTIGVDIDPAEAAREASDAQFNLSLGWIPGLGTVYNALSLAMDATELVSALVDGDVAGIVDEIGDIAVDVVGLVPIVGGPLAAGIHYLFAGSAVTPGNQLPNAVTDNFVMNEDTTLTGNVLANDIDPEGDPMTAALNTVTSHGSVAMNADGSFTYTPAANFFGADSFSYTVSDGTGVSIGVVNITVNDVAEPPPPPPPPPVSPWTRPVNGYRVTQEYGGAHTGIDLALGAGQPVYAAADGVIYFEGWGTSGNNGARSNWMGTSAGISVLIQHDAQGVMTGYAHLSRTVIDQGQRVSKGQVIGYVGCTGQCTGPHLHFEVLPMPLNSRTGIYGRVNPRNYMSL
ncbi:hypothetical protein MMUR_26800 [Mycolicibacterium murale]|uniref:M23ase beta-sheet core domain-containing protein n=1 Tax=Mycolicibacterium murale TaxID=182220 RepID=A0A7I9WLI2_9MYCO|nr:peptidoglycan DD-metalloendopeptidase family protein [Mycolicibacterium murale]GFG58544.1 hypothetical protein MMUR_26800 [Mycolicibacterium murale]